MSAKRSRAKKKKSAAKRSQSRLKQRVSEACLEAIIVEFIDSITSAIYVLAEVTDGTLKSRDGKFTQTRAFKGLLAICMVEGGNLEGHMAHYMRGAPMSKRHRAAQLVLTPWLESVLADEDVVRLAHVDMDYEVNNDPSVVSMVQDTRAMLVAMHVAMHVDSKPHERNRAVRKFEACVGWG